MFLYAIISTALLWFSSDKDKRDENYEKSIKFYGYNSNNPEFRFVSSKLLDECDPNGKFAFVVHGWNESINTTWVHDVLQNLLTYRGGCVIFMDYSVFGNNPNYFALVDHKAGIINLLLKKMRQTNRLDQVYCFGFSFGARVCSAAGKLAGNQLLERMDLCDRAGYGFDYYEDPKPAAKNVACIDTSWDRGTNVYNCHQNFRMGFYGYSQPAAGPYPLGSHGLCPYFYNSSFTNDFVPNNYYNCWSDRIAKNLTSDVKMGYRAEFNRTAVRGDIFIGTAKYPPYVLVNNNLNNKPNSDSTDFFKAFQLIHNLVL